MRYFRSLYEGDTEDPQNLLELVGLADSADLPVGQYSKGMKARLNFARSLLVIGSVSTTLLLWWFVRRFRRIVHRDFPEE